MDDISVSHWYNGNEFLSVTLKSLEAQHTLLYRHEVHSRCGPCGFCNIASATDHRNTENISFLGYVNPYKEPMAKSV